MENKLLKYDEFYLLQIRIINQIVRFWKISIPVRCRTVTSVFITIVKLALFSFNNKTQKTTIKLILILDQEAKLFIFADHLEISKNKLELSQSYQGKLTSIQVKYRNQ